MNNATNNPTNRVPSRDLAVRYMERTRNYYRALGYKHDYTWAQNDDIPFTSPNKPLSEQRVALITTSSPAGTTSADVPGVWSGDTANVPAAMYTENLAWDRETTHTNDVGSFLPITALQQMVEAQQLGSLAPRYHGVPTEYSQRQTVDNDAPELLDRLIADQVDVALLVPL